MQMKTAVMMPWVRYWYRCPCKIFKTAFDGDEIAGRAVKWLLLHFKRDPAKAGLTDPVCATENEDL